MTTRQRVIVSFGGLVLIALLVFMVFSERGLADLSRLKKERRQLVEKNAVLASENRYLSDEIDRLKHDPAFIEQIARRKLGMIGRDELIVKPADGGSP